MLQQIIDWIPAAIIAIIVAFIVILIWRKLHDNEGLKYEFVTIITHKFRTPLTHIKWILDDLIRSEPDAYRRENLTQIQKANEDLVKLIAALIELMDGPNSKESSYKFERIDLVAMIKENYAATERFFKEKNISVSFYFSAPEIFIKADHSRVEFILLTILENAYMYSFSGSIVSIAATIKRKNVIFSVTDNGIGIDSWDMSHVATKFFRSKQARAMDTEGFGVNLYLARSIIERHHGKLIIYSDGLKKGSTFSVILPMAK